MESIKKRYSSKVLRSGIDALINFSLLLFVPRVLGPAGFGSFSYIRDSFQNIIGLSDLNLGAAHNNHTARNDNSALATNVYFSYTLFLGFVLLTFVTVVGLTGIQNYIFPDQDPLYLFVGALLAYLMYLFNALMGLSDSKGSTFGFELRSLYIGVVAFVVLLAVYNIGYLNLTTFFGYRVLLYVVLLSFGVWYLYRTIGLRLRIVMPWQPGALVIVKEFFSFAHPLITLGIFGMVFGFFDRWFLQFVYGSLSQGYFSLAFSLSSIASLFLAPMTPLLMQSVARADQIDDLSAVRVAFEKVKFLYLVGVVISLFCMFHSQEILALIGGEDYSGAWITLVVMFLYPIHMVYGQFCGAVLIAMRKTGLYRNIALISTVGGGLISYFLLSPKSFVIPGLELGSLGLALKLVLIQLISVGIQLLFVCKLIKAKFSEYVFSQILILILVFLIGACEWFISQHFSIASQSQIEVGLKLAMLFVLWTFLAAFFVWCFPGIVGVERGVLRTMVLQSLAAIRNKR
jgi:O-antigen/teichoic acid export membrane protein